MKEAMRESLKECLGSMKKKMRDKRALAYAGEENEEEEESEEMADDTPSMKRDGKALQEKVSEAEAAADEELEDSEDWRQNEVKEFMTKKARPKVRKEGSFMMAGMSKTKGKKGKA